MDLSGFDVYAGVDLIGGVTKAGSAGGSVSKKASFFAIFVAGVDGNGTRRVLNIVRKRGLTFQMQKDEIKALRRYGPKLIAIEDNNTQRWMVSDLIETTDLPVKGFTTGANKWDPITGVESLALELENGKWIFPYGNDVKTNELVDVLMGELKSWPLSATTDVVMAMWLCAQGIRMSDRGKAIAEKHSKFVDKALDFEEELNVYEKVAKGLWQEL